MRAIAAGATDIGRVRERNEDAYALGDLDAAALSDGDGALTCTGPRGLFAIVCDGMGGAAGGEVASELAARTAWRELCAAHDTDDPQVCARLVRRAVRAANRRVFDEAQRETSLRGMGTTLSAVAVAGGHVIVAQVGDSRVYLARAGMLTQITRDQTLASALVGAGRDPLEAAIAGGSTILQALGVNPDVEASLSIIALCRGDRLLLCSDGLYNQLGPGALEAIVVGRAGPAAIARSLCDAARAAGGNDNITAIVVDLDGDELPTDDGRAPKFLEFDPREDGDRALTSTSYVVRRLAAAAGLEADPGPPGIPATGRFSIPSRRRVRASAPPPRPAPPPRSWLTPAILFALALAAGSLGFWLAG